MTAFLAFLMFAVQVLIHLFATSIVSAAAFDAARLASGSEAVTEQAAQAHGMGILGRFSDRVTDFDVTVGAESVSVSVRAKSPALLPRAWGRVIGAESIDRTVVVRRERPVCPDGTC